MKNSITDSAKHIPTKCLNAISNKANNKIETPKGITSANVCEIFGGTSSGIWIVIFLLTQNLYTLHTKNATKKAVNNPLDPMYPLENPPLIESTPTTKKPTIPAIRVEILLICLLTGISLFKLSHKFFAVVPATSTANNPIE